MKVYEVLIEYSTSKLDRLFSYVYDGEINLLCRVIVPFAHKDICGVVINIIDFQGNELDYKNKTGFELKKIKKVIDKTPLLNEELNNLTKEISEYYYAPRISVFLAMLPPSLKPSLSSQNKPTIAYEQFIKAKDNVDYDNLTLKQADLLMKIINEKVKKSDCSPSILNQLIKKDKVEIYNVEKQRLNLNKVEKKEKLTLNDEQLICYNSILNDDKDIFLLEGVTGSGKTEVYMQVAEKIIENKQKVIMLVPEISLSYQMVQRFQERFSRIAILHSKLTPGQRYDEYRRIKNGEVDIVIGARSAIFAPLDNIGLIIIDEEHSETYKQDDQLPFYNALDVAKMRQKYHSLKIVLGSATPSLETKSRALKGLYKQLYLTKRINNLPLPKVQVVDMSDKTNIDKESVLISKPLKEAIQERLNNHEQTMLLVNRRGYSPYVSCRKCGNVMKCPNCQVALTYHYETNRLVCHHCEFNIPMVHECPKCGSNKMFKGGFGTEKIELEIKKLFPNIRTLRLDSDISKKKNATNEVLNKFQNNEADILIGTQIIAKGHDFSNVTLVGIVLADIGLAIPSFRANERTFSLITQAIGRSGRSKNGEAIIQTYLKNNFVIKTSSKQDYLSFYATEIALRKAMQNPPYTFLALLVVSGNKEEDVIDVIEEVNRYLKSKLENNAILIGPGDMFIKKYQNQYRRKIIIKYKDFSLIKPCLDDLSLFFNKKNNLKLIININPYEDY